MVQIRKLQVIGNGGQKLTGFVVVFREPATRTASVMDEAAHGRIEAVVRTVFAFLPTIVVALIFLAMSFVDVQALAEQLRGNATHVRIVLPPPPPPSPPPFVPPTLLSITQLRCLTGAVDPGLLRLLVPLADAVRRTEPHMLAFELLRSELAPDGLLLLERFRSRADMPRPQRSSPAYLAFKRQLARAGIVDDAKGSSSWLSTDVGFVSRGGAHHHQQTRLASSNHSRQARWGRYRGLFV